MAKLSDKRLEELRVWVFKSWNLHWKELAPVSNSRAQFYKYVVRDNKSDEELERIGLAIEAQARHWRKQNSKEKVIGIPTLSVWYNQSRYDDEFIDESAMAMGDKKSYAPTLPECSESGCTEPVHGSGFTKCAFHIGSNDPKLRESYKALNLDIKSPDFVDNCRKLCREKMGILTKKAEVMK